MRLVFLGTGGWFPSKARQTVSLVLPEKGIFLDAGTGFFRFPGFCKQKEIHILLSHTHLDHSIGLLWLKGLFKGKRVHLYGDKGIKTFLKTLFNSHFTGQTLEDFPFELVFHEGIKECMIQGINVKSMRFPHGKTGGLGFRLEDKEKSVCYITDTVASLKEAGLAEESDVLIHECFFDNANKKTAIAWGHSYSKIVGELAAKADVKKLILTHFNPMSPEKLKLIEKEVKSIFPNVLLSSDLQEIKI